jgi:hypothetical protein
MNRPDGWPQATIVGYVNDGLTLYFLCSPQSQTWGFSAKAGFRDARDKLLEPTMKNLSDRRTFECRDGVRPPACVRRSVP